MARVLYAEDDPSVGSLVEFRLGADGHEVTVAADGTLAQQLLRDQRFDLVLLDVMMPGVDGFALCREVTRHPDAPPVVMVTAREAEADLTAARAAGAADYVVKPFDPDDLAERIEALLADRR